MHTVLCTYKNVPLSWYICLFVVRPDFTALHIGRAPLIFNLYKVILPRLRRGEKKMRVGDGNYVHVLRHANHDNPYSCLTQDKTCNSKLELRHEGNRGITSGHNLGFLFCGRIQTYNYWLLGPYQSSCFYLKAIIRRLDSSPSSGKSLLSWAQSIELVLLLVGVVPVLVLLSRDRD
jgi:hypothetical protein